MPCVGDWRNGELGSELSVVLLQFMTCCTVKKYFFLSSDWVFQHTMVKTSSLTNTVAVSALWDATQLKVSWPCFCFAQEQTTLCDWWSKYNEDTALCDMPEDWCNAGTVSCTRDSGVCPHQRFTHFQPFFSLASAPCYGQTACTQWVAQHCTTLSTKHSLGGKAPHSCMASLRGDGGHQWKAYQAATVTIQTRHDKYKHGYCSSAAFP